MYLNFSVLLFPHPILILCRPLVSFILGVSHVRGPTCLLSVGSLQRTLIFFQPHRNDSNALLIHGS